jgi:maleate isomerase
MSETAAESRPATTEPAVNRRHLPCTLDAGIGARASLGLIVLATDGTIEYEFRRVLEALPGVALYQSRIFNSASITPATLKAMESGIGPAAELILPGARLDVIAYGCTSASMVIGEAEVAQRIRAARPGVACTTPITGALAGLRALGAKRLALLTPYIDEINRFMRDYIEARGFSVPVMGSFNEEDDRKVARIAPQSVREAALELGRSELVDAVFVSCTSLRLVEVVAELESELGKPATSSNHAIAWHALRLAGVNDPLPQFGRLFTLAL